MGMREDLIRNDKPLLILSHPRSGMHLVRLSLFYLKYGTFYPLDYDYDLEWEHFSVHFAHSLAYCHLESCPARIEEHKAMLFIIRDFRDLIIRHKIQKDLLGEAKLNISHYVALINYYDVLKVEKMLVYYDDLLKDFNKIFEIADFFNIKPADDISAEELKQEAFTIYKRHHIPSPKKLPVVDKAEIDEAKHTIMSSLGHEKYIKYLLRYDTEVL